MKDEKIIIILAVTSIIFGIIGVSLSLYNQWLNATDYWGFAPDGEYDVFVDTEYCVDYQTHIVKLPICEHSGGDLHGDWSFTDNVTFLPYKDGNFTHCGYYRVILERNIIRNARQLGAWNFTKHDWEFS